MNFKLVIVLGCQESAEKTEINLVYNKLIGAVLQFI